MFTTDKKLQYEITNSYDRNEKVERFENGRSIGYTILSDWEVPGYTQRLEEEGYTQGYNREDLAKKIMDLEDDLKYYKSEYERILQNNQFIIGT